MEDNVKNKFKTKKIIISIILIILLILLIVLLVKCMGAKDIKTNNDSNMGMVARGDNYTFYYKYDVGLIKIKDNKEYQIADEQAYSISYNNGFVYYTTPSNNGGISIKKVSHNGDTNVVLTSTTSESMKMYLEDGYLYYLSTNPNTLQKIDLDGKNQSVVLTRTISDFEVSDGIIYFTDDNGYLYKVDTNGENYSQITEKKISRKFQLLENEVYYYNSDTKKLMKINLKNNEESEVSDKLNCDTFNITDTAIYYLDIENSRICSMNLKGKNDKEIVKVNTSNTKINLIDADLYYLDAEESANSYRTHRIKISGKVVNEIKY